jgi:subtilisin family serine protease
MNTSCTCICTAPPHESARRVAGLRKSRQNPARRAAWLAALVSLILAFLFPSLAMSGPEDETHSRLGLGIKELAALPQAQRRAFASAPGLMQVSESGDVPVIIEYAGDPESLREAGAKLRTCLGNIFTADVPLDKVDSVAALPELRYMRAATLFQPMLDVSVPDTGASLVRSGTPPSWTGYTGKGVIVGVVDTGLDFEHADFKNASGTTRVLYYWDQTTGTGGANHPSGYDYGTEWTKAQIDAGQCTVKETTNHGTAITGIAAGSGAATGYGWPAYRYVGMAPEADLIIVKTTFYDDKIVDGMNYIKGKANSLTKPFAINLSIGSQYGAHDGTHLLERSIDLISGQGAVVCTASGNNRSSDTTHYVHADWTVPSRDSTATANLSVPSNRANPFVLDIWYEGGDSIDMKVTTPNGYSVTKATGSTTGGYYSTPDGNIWLENAPPLGSTNPYNGDRECIILVQNALAGTWSVTATGKTITQGGYCDAWTQSGQNVFWATCGNNSKTCSIPGTSTTVITAGGYMTKTRWTNPDGTRQGWDGILGEFYPWSGEGPTRDGRTKPDLGVPTSRIVAALSHDWTPTPTDVVEDGVHVVNTGTSMAVPHMVGAAALLLQKDPTATPAEIRSRIISTARADSQTGAVPNYRWGYGKLAVNAAMPLMPLYTNISTARVQPAGSLVKLPDQVVSAGYTQMGDRFYIESSDKSSGVQVRMTSGTQPNEKDKVTVIGAVDVADGERAVINSAVTRTGVGTGTVPDPLGIVNRALGGDALGLIPGITGGTGLNNVGLLVRAWGKVKSIGSDYFMMSDGYGIGGQSYREIKVRCPALTKPSSTSQYAVVTGISSLQLSGSTAIPIIRVRKQADLVYYTP